LANIDEWTGVQTGVRIWFAMCAIRRMVPFKQNVKHPMEDAPSYVTNIANPNLVVDISGVRFP
jgi:hypothetical protein